MSHPMIALCLAALLGGCGAIKAADDDVAAFVTHHHGIDSNVNVFDGEMKLITAFAVVDVASVIATKKTVDDHVVSLISGRDCSTIKAMHGEPYCRDIPQPVPTVAQTTYCYKSLASVSCYDRPLPSDAARFTAARTDEIPIAP